MKLKIILIFLFALFYTVIAAADQFQAGAVPSYEDREMLLRYPMKGKKTMFYYGDLGVIWNPANRMKASAKTTPFMPSISDTEDWRIPPVDWEEPPPWDPPEPPPINLDCGTLLTINRHCEYAIAMWKRSDWSPPLPLGYPDHGYWKVQGSSYNDVNCFQFIMSHFDYADYGAGGGVLQGGPGIRFKIDPDGAIPDPDDNSVGICQFLITHYTEWGDICQWLWATECPTACTESDFILADSGGVEIGAGSTLDTIDIFTGCTEVQLRSGVTGDIVYYPLDWTISGASWYFNSIGGPTTWQSGTTEDQSGATIIDICSSNACADAVITVTDACENTDDATVDVLSDATLTIMSGVTAVGQGSDGDVIEVGGCSSYYVNTTKELPNYTWTISGTGFSFDLVAPCPGGATSSSVVTVASGTSVTIYADGTACGTATVTATDRCGNTTTAYVKSTAGQWVICYDSGLIGSCYTDNWYCYLTQEGHHIKAYFCYPGSQSAGPHSGTCDDGWEGAWYKADFSPCSDDVVPWRWRTLAWLTLYKWTCP